MTNSKSHPVPTYAAYGGVPTDEANFAGVGTAFDWANRATEFVGTGLSGYGAITKGIPALRDAYNGYNIYRGTRNLEKSASTRK